MAVNFYLFYKFPYNLLKNKISDLSASTTKIKVMLLSSSANPSQSTWDNKSDVTNEITGTGYTAGGKEITNKTVTETSGTIIFDGDDVEWTSATFTARYAVIYDDTPTTNTDKKLIGYIDFGEDKSVENGTFKIVWNEAGIFTITNT